MATRTAVKTGNWSDPTVWDIDPEPLLDWGEQPEQPAEPALYLPINDPLTLAAKTEKERYAKVRWWLEEAERKDRDAMPEYARAIRLALVRLLYEWEREA